MKPKQISRLTFLADAINVQTLRWINFKKRLWEQVKQADMKQTLVGAGKGLILWVVIATILVGIFLAPGDNGHSGTPHGMQTELLVMLMTFPIFLLGGVLLSIFFPAASSPAPQE